MSIIEEDDLNSVSNENSALLSLQQNLQDPTELEAHNYDTLETENLVLRRNMPRLYDAQGKDVTNTFILLQERLNDLTLKNEQLEMMIKEKRDYTQMKRELMADYHRKHQELLNRIQAQERASNTEVESTPNASPVPDDLLEDYQNDQAERIVELEDTCRNFEEELELLRNENADLNNRLEESEIQKQRAIEQFHEVKALLEQKDLDIQKRDKVIRGLKKLIPPQVNDENYDWNNFDSNSRSFWVKKLQQIVNIVDPNWEKNESFKKQWLNFIDTARSESPNEDNQETASEIVENLNQDRKNLGKEFAEVFGSDTSIDLSSSFVVDQSLQLMEHFGGLKKEMLKMFETLQGMMPFLERLLSEIVPNSQTSQLINKVNTMKKEFNKCIQEISIKIINVEDLEKTLNETLTNQRGHSPTDGNDSRDLVRLQNEVDTLRANLKKEVETKDGMKKENATLRGELRSIQDEKMTIQRELLDITEKFEQLEREYAAIQQQLENGSQNHETVELLRAKQHIQKLDSKIISTTKENDVLLSRIENLKQRLEQQEKTYGDAFERIHAENEQLRDALLQYHQKEEQYQLQEEEFKKLMDDRANCAERKQLVQSYEKRIKEYEKNIVALAERTKGLHEDNVKFGYYIQSVVSAAATGKYDKMKRPDNIDESAHAIIMDLLEGTSDEVKQKFEYSLEVMKDLCSKMTNSRPPSSTHRSPSPLEIVSSREYLGYEEVISSFERAHEEAVKLVNLAKCKDYGEYSQKNILNKSRELRNKIKAMLDIYIEKQQMTKGKSHRTIAEELDKIHRVLSDNGSTRSKTSNKSTKKK